MPLTNSDEYNKKICSLTTGKAQEIIKVMASLHEAGTDAGTRHLDLTLPPRWDQLKKKCRKLPDVVFGKNTGLDLGCHPELSVSYVLPVDDPGMPLGEVIYYGPDFSKELIKKGRVSYLQIVLLRIQEKPDWDIDQLLIKRSLVGRIPGFMARSRGMHTSIKMHKELLMEGFTRDMLIYNLADVYSEFSGGPQNISIVLGLDADKICSLLAPHVREVENFIASMNEQSIRKTYEECLTQGNCTMCDDRIICDRIRTITRLREEKKNEV